MHWRCRTSRLSSFCKDIMCTSDLGNMGTYTMPILSTMAVLPQSWTNLLLTLDDQGCWDFLECMTAQTSDLTFSCQVFPRWQLYLDCISEHVKCPKNQIQPMFSSKYYLTWCADVIQSLNTLSLSLWISWGLRDANFHELIVQVDFGRGLMPCDGIS
jgi:hypothetical protein